MKYMEKVREYLKNTSVANINSIALLVGNKNYTYVLLNNLLKKGYINRIEKGYYTMHEDPSLIVYCLKPAYLGLQDAVSFHGLWEQETCPIVITTRKVRTGVRKVFGHNVVIRRILPKYFFGYDYYKYGDFVFPVSDVEKTFIDLVYFREIKSELAKEFKKKINFKNLTLYLKKYPDSFRCKVLSRL
jgi:predicted transcriptional regulator of viral defense system